MKMNHQVQSLSSSKARGRFRSSVFMFRTVEYCRIQFNQALYSFKQNQSSECKCLLHLIALNKLTSYYIFFFEENFRKKAVHSFDCL